jgi:metal-responsive CopG/Arc/MetJ family transcriptional regulator
VRSGLDSELLDFVDDVVDELGSRDHLIHQILKMELERLNS